MPSQKPRVISYLDESEAKAFQEFKQKKGFSDSQAVMHLVNQHLMPGRDDAKTDEHDDGQLGRLERLEALSEDNRHLRQYQAGAIDKIERWLAEIDSQIEDLKRKADRTLVTLVTDDQIAALTGQREQTVKEWRHGLRKPRGERILKALEPYVVKDGRWIKRQ